MPRCVRWGGFSPVLAALLLGACAGGAQRSAVVGTPAAPDVSAGQSAVFAFQRIGGVLQQAGYARGQAPPGTQRLTLDGTQINVAADGGFFIAFSRDAAPSVLLRAEGASGVWAELRMDLLPRTFPEERLPERLQAYSADPGFAALRSEELSRIAAARSTPSAEAGWRAIFIAPTSGRISGVFGSQRFYGDVPQSPHSGLDFAAAVGTPVVAPAAGIVVLASPPVYSLEGNLVILDHGQGLYSSFLHLSRIDVRVGDHLAAGAPIGAVGATGRVTGAQLHWGVVWQGVRFDPATLLPPEKPASLILQQSYN